MANTLDTPADLYDDGYRKLQNLRGLIVNKLSNADKLWG